MEYPKNLILKISNIGIVGTKDGQMDKNWRPKSKNIAHSRVTREILHEIFDPFGTILHINFISGRTEATLRFKGIENSDKQATQNILEKYAETGLTLGCEKVKLEIVTGDEELAEWKFLLDKGLERKQKHLDRVQQKEKSKNNVQGKQQYNKRSMK